VPDAACVALNQQNAALSDKLGELEGKVGALQKALAVPVLPVAAVPVPVVTAPAAEAPYAKPRALHAAPVKEKKSSGGGLWWLGLGTLIFLLLTALIVYVWRKRRQKAGDRPPSKYWVLLRKPFRRKPVPVLTETVGEAKADEDGVPAEAEPSPFSR
jgi:pilus assembly protein FimV